MERKTSLVAVFVSSIDTAASLRAPLPPPSASACSMPATDWQASTQNAPNERQVSRNDCSPCIRSLVTKRWNSSAT